MSVSARRPSVTTPVPAGTQPELPFDDGLSIDPRSIPPGCVAVPLTNGGYAIVDEEDECRVDEHRWFKRYNKDSRTWYAVTYLGHSKKDSGFRFMHRYLFGLTKEDEIQVDHRNHNGLDNRRSTNIRLATRRQNTMNRRKFNTAGSAHHSEYKGVSWTKHYGKWVALIAFRINSKDRQINLGYYEVEEEAAFAYRVATEILKDPEFLCVKGISEDKMPDPKRQREIREIAISRIKARLEGKKGSRLCLSEYKGVSCYLPSKNWYAHIAKNGKQIFYFPSTSEIEAAYAYDVAVRLLGSNKKLNGVNEADISSPGRAIEIRGETAARIEAHRTGAKVRNASSRFRGVNWRANRSKWVSRVSPNRRLLVLGQFETQVEAAIAYNCAVEIIGNPKLRPNPIAPEEMPDPHVVASIEEKVRPKVCDFLVSRG